MSFWRLDTLFLTFLVLLTLIVSPMLGPANETVAPPFCKPLWLDPTSGRPLSLNAKDNILSFAWESKPPKAFSVKGTVSFEEVPKDAALLLVSPKKTYKLMDLAGRKNLDVDIDSRDVPLKLHLGLNPFVEVSSVIFSEKGTYSLYVRSDVKAHVNLNVNIYTGKWGIFGTDQRGRDVFRLFVQGIKISLLVGIFATLIASTIGMGLGLIAGYLGGLTDSSIMRAVDVLLAIPTLPMLVVISGVWGRGLWQIVLVLSIFSWMGTARMVRSLTLSLREAPYVEGLRALGAPAGYILVRHFIPEALPLLLAQTVLGVPGAILAEAGLSFLGLSDPLMPSWGRMLHEAQVFGAFTGGAWWLIFPPGLGIASLCLAFISIGRRFEEMADPRLKEMTGR